MTTDPGLHNVGLAIVLGLAFLQWFASVLHRCTCSSCPHCHDERRRRDEEQERLKREWDERFRPK